MTAPLKAIDGTADLPALMTDLAAQARAAARVLALAPPEQKNRALEAIERAIRANAAKILAANAEDVAEVRAGGATSAFIDRLTLTPARIDAMADGVATVRGIARSGRRRHRELAAAERHDHRARARAARRDRRDLREPSQCRGRCRRAVPEVRQRRDPARRLRQFPLLPRHP